MENDLGLEKYIKAIVVVNSEQEKIIGKSIANIISKNIDGLNYNGINPIITGNPKEILKNLVDGYATIFGKASLVVSKEAIRKISPAFTTNELPENLR